MVNNHAQAFDTFALDRALARQCFTVIIGAAPGRISRPAPMAIGGKGARLDALPNADIGPEIGIARFDARRLPPVLFGHTGVDLISAAIA